MIVHTTSSRILNGNSSQCALILSKWALFWLILCFLSCHHWGTFMVQFFTSFSNSLGQIIVCQSDSILLINQKIALYEYRLFFLRSIVQFFYTNLHELFCQFISWTNWVNSGKFLDNSWISCQVMADMEKLYDDLIIINLCEIDI